MADETDGVIVLTQLKIIMLLSQLPSYSRDTTGFLNRLHSIENIQASDFLCSLDVTSLCTNVPDLENLEALSSYLNQRENPTPHTEFIVDLTKLVLNRNYFKFENSYNLSFQGVSMGSPCSPDFANLFMGSLRRTLCITTTRFLLY